MREEPMDRNETETPAALRALDEVRAPDALRLAVADAVAAAERRHAARRRPLARLGALRPPAFAAAGMALAVAIALVVVIVSTSGTGAPTVQQVADVALRPPVAAAPAARPGGELLTAHVDAIVYPTWARVGWHAVGMRTDTVGGHALRTVFYADAQGRRIGYAIADAALPVDGGRVVVRRGAQLRVLTRGGAEVVTWRRDGHTCILAGRGVDVARLVQLASYAA
jgi:hypothetical protein